MALRGRLSEHKCDMRFPYGMASFSSVPCQTLPSDPSCHRRWSITLMDMHGTYGHMREQIHTHICPFAEALRRFMNTHARARTVSPSHDTRSINTYITVTGDLEEEAGMSLIITLEDEAAQTQMC